VKKLESAPRGFTLGVKAEIFKIFSICPNLLINAELYGLLLAPRLKKRIPSKAPFTLGVRAEKTWGQL
jgi:hypothetical protein